jgi:hypothetical protein
VFWRLGIGAERVLVCRDVSGRAQRVVICPDADGVLLSVSAPGPLRLSARQARLLAERLVR